MRSLQVPCLDCPSQAAAHGFHLWTRGSLLTLGLCILGKDGYSRLALISSCYSDQFCNALG